MVVIFFWYSLEGLRPKLLGRLVCIFFTTIEFVNFDGKHQEEL
jgi:hypothetical protein